MPITVCFFPTFLHLTVSKSFISEQHFHDEQDFKAPSKALPELQYSDGTKNMVTAEEVTNVGVIRSVNIYKAEHGAWPAEYTHGPPQVSGRPHEWQVRLDYSKP